MKKSEFKKKEKYWSIMVLPHTTQEVKVFTISSLKYKLLALGVVATTCTVCLGILLTHLFYTNRSLCNDKEKIIEANMQQQKLITEKQEILESYIDKMEEQDKLVENFAGLYKNMTNQYIDGQMENITATRSCTGRNDHAFINDANKLKSILDELEKNNCSDPEIVENLTKTQSKLKDYTNAIPSLWPCEGRISSYFGIRDDPFNYTKKAHSGIDIVADYGQHIKASAKGKVVLSEYYGNYGNCIIVDHGYGLSTLYGHCSALLAKVGQNVDKGDLIAKVGNTGRSTGPHLHFEIRINDTPIDPLSYLNN